MNEVKRYTFLQLAARYCERQDSMADELLEVLKGQRTRFTPDGWFLAECQDMSSSAMGSLVILPYGPNNTFKTVPPADKTFSPRGLASDMSTAVAFMPVADLPDAADPVADSAGTVFVPDMDAADAAVRARLGRKLKRWADSGGGAFYTDKLKGGQRRATVRPHRVRPGYVVQFPS